MPSLNITELFDIQDCFEYTDFKYVNRNEVKIEFEGSNSFLYKVIPIKEFEEFFYQHGSIDQLVNNNRFNFSTKFLQTYFDHICNYWLLSEELTEEFVLFNLNEFVKDQWFYICENEAISFEFLFKNIPREYIYCLVKTRASSFTEEIIVANDYLKQYITDFIEVNLISADYVKNNWEYIKKHEQYIVVKIKLDKEFIFNNIDYQKYITEIIYYQTDWPEKIFGLLLKQRGIDFLANKNPEFKITEKLLDSLDYISKDNLLWAGSNIELSEEFVNKHFDKPCLRYHPAKLPINRDPFFKKCIETDPSCIKLIPNPSEDLKQLVKVLSL